MWKEKDVAARFNVFHPGDPLKEESVSGFFLRAAGLLVSIFGFTVSLTCLYLGMRGVMRLGGFVASGGPYAIAHPAPTWVWIVPVSIFVGMFFVALNIFMIRRIGGVALLVLAWPALFCSLGWNFLEFGIHPPGGSGPAWGWLVCAVLFLAMGGIPLVIVVRKIVRFSSGRAFSFPAVPRIQENDVAGGTSRFSGRKSVRLLMLFLQLAAIGLGIIEGARFFGGISGEKQHPPAAVKSADQSIVRTEREDEKTRQPRIVLVIGTNRCEIFPGEKRMVFNGGSYVNPGSLPSEARRVIRQALDALSSWSNAVDGRPLADAGRH